MSRDGKWTFADVGEEIWNNEDFDTREEAIEAGFEYMKDEYYAEYGTNDILSGTVIEFEVGQCSIHVPHVCVDYIVNQLQEDAYEECGEVAEDFLCNVTKGEVKILEERLNDVVRAWLEDMREEPNFYSITNIETIKLEVI
jgi:hypothetical protein